jgi:hypothetical protein
VENIATQNGADIFLRMVYRRGVVFNFEVGARASKLTLVVEREIESSLTMLSYLISTIYVNPLCQPFMSTLYVNPFPFRQFVPLVDVIRVCPPSLLVATVRHLRDS